MPLNLYADPCSQPSLACYYVLKKLGIDHEFVQKLAGECTRKPDFLAINPLGKVPTLEHDGFVLTESVAILHYLCDSFEGGEKLLPRDDLKKRATVNQWLQWNGSELRHPNEKVWFLVHFNHLWLGLPEASDEEKQKAIDEAKKVIKHLDDHLKDNKYVAGDEFSIADVQVFMEEYITMTACKFDLSEFANITEWFDRLKTDEILAKLLEDGLANAQSRLP